jgi:hypothetical protein
MRIKCVPASLPRSEQVLMSLILDLEVGIQRWRVLLESALLCEEITICKQ